MADIITSKIGSSDYQNVTKTDVSREKLFGRLRSFTEKIVAGGFQSEEKPDFNREKRFDRLRSFTEKVIAIQNATHPGRPAVLPAETLPKTFAFRVAKARVRCHQHFLNGFEKLELTEVQRCERRHALAQKLITKSLRQSDRRPRKRLIRVIRKKIISSPFMTFIRWLGVPLVRLARVASLAAAKVELRQAALSKKSARVTSFPCHQDTCPLLSRVGDGHGTT